MATETILGKLRSFLGLQPGTPINDFRNPIWGSDDEDDDDDLYSRQHNTEGFSDIDVHQELARQMHDIFSTFGGFFGDMKSLFHYEQDPFPGINNIPDEPDGVNSNSIREYYLKPGFHRHKHDQLKEDIDLDGKISSHEISGLLKKKDSGPSNTTIEPFGNTFIPGRSFCQTIITTSIKKPDGTVETRKIVKNGDEVIEEVTTTMGSDVRGPQNSGMNPNSNHGLILSELGSLFRNFY